METYFTTILISEYLIPVIIFIVLGLVAVTWIVYTVVSEKIKFRYLKNQGWEKQVDISDPYTEMKLYKFVKSGRSISEARIDRMSYTELKRFVEDGHKH